VSRWESAAAFRSVARHDWESCPLHSACGSVPFEAREGAVSFDAESPPRQSLSGESFSQSSGASRAAIIAARDTPARRQLTLSRWAHSLAYRPHHLLPGSWQVHCAESGKDRAHRTQPPTVRCLQPPEKPYRSAWAASAVSSEESADTAPSASTETVGRQKGKPRTRTWR
jgi:hypothetical protein